MTLIQQAKPNPVARTVANLLCDHTCWRVLTSRQILLAYPNPNPGEGFDLFALRRLEAVDLTRPPPLVAKIRINKPDAAEIFWQDEWRLTEVGHLQGKSMRQADRENRVRKQWVKFGLRLCARYMAFYGNYQITFTNVGNKKEFASILQNDVVVIDKEISPSSMRIETNWSRLFSNDNGSLFSVDRRYRSFAAYSQPDPQLITASSNVVQNVGAVTPIVAIPVAYGADYLTYCWGREWQVRAQIPDEKIAEAYRDLCGLPGTKLSIANPAEWTDDLQSIAAVIIDTKTIPLETAKNLLGSKTLSGIWSKIVPNGAILVQTRCNRNDVGFKQSDLPARLVEKLADNLWRITKDRVG